VAGFCAAALFLLLTARPFMSVLLSAAVLILLVALNRAKETVLREDLVLSDALLLRQALLYPELYLPFLPVKGLAAGCALLCLCLAPLALLEPAAALPRSAGGAALLAAAASVPPLCLVLLRFGCFPSLAAQLLRLCPVGHDAAADARRNGPLASALLHPVLAGQWEKTRPDFLLSCRTRPTASRWPEHFELLLEKLDSLPQARPPHVLLLQAESFHDIRGRLPAEQREALADFLPNWDRLKQNGQTLPTPESAFGAYTMRTEFSMLTGLQQEDLGPWAFNPYLLAARRPLWSLARHFAARGYDTLCLHPYHKGFFRRDKVMPNLGFRRFLGLEELGRLERCGPHVSDPALGREAMAQLQASEKPVFCFIISMENHGPWLEGRLSAGEIAKQLHPLDPELFDWKTRLYLCHLRHADQLMGMLDAAPADGSGAVARICVAYGDHPPNL
jgi:hypothetical protein